MANTGSRLGSGLIVRKGEAAPPVQTVAAELAAPVEASPAVPPMPKGVAGTVAVTVRLDQPRYERLKMHGVRERRTNQQILVAALDAYLASNERN
ncbi:MAG TPA: hypothetical protein VGG11_14620 [Xanthobacteraceae bacterium]|jgi:hypothetical protein